MKIILVRPQLGSNIGAIARVMKNFSCEELCLVNPRSNWLDDNAVALAAGAEDLLKTARVYTSIAEAAEDLTALYALTARTRYLNKPLLDAKDFKKEIINTNNIGLMLGPENSGLSNEDLTLAQKIIYIPTNPAFSSLNISQAAAIILHEAYQHTSLPLKANRKYSTNATINEIDGFLNHLELQLNKTDFLRIEAKKADMLRNIKNIFTRIDNLSSQEISTLRGIITALAPN